MMDKRSISTSLPFLTLGNRIRHGASSPSPRLPLGRLRPSSTGYGEGRGEGAFPNAQAVERAPPPPPPPRPRAPPPPPPGAGGGGRPPHAPPPPRARRARRAPTHTHRPAGRAGRAREPHGR